MPGIDLSDHFDTDYLTDLIIKCRDKQWRVHKLVVAGQSDWFRKACDGSFKEAQSGEIDLSDDDPEYVEAMLRFFYAGTCIPSEETQLAVPCLRWMANLHAIADKYQLRMLMDDALKHFRNTLQERYYRIDELMEDLPMIHALLPTQEGGAERQLLIDVVMQEYCISLCDDSEEIVGVPSRKAQDLAMKLLVQAASSSHDLALDMLKNLADVISKGNSRLAGQHQEQLDGHCQKSYKCDGCLGKVFKWPFDMRPLVDAYKHCTTCVFTKFMNDMLLAVQLLETASPTHE